MPPRGRLVTFLTTVAAALLAVVVPGAPSVTGAGAETVREGALQVSFGGSVAPHVLPRAGTTPVAVEIRGRVRAVGGGPPASLRRIAIEVNRLGVLERGGLPVCPIGRLRAASTEAALAACGPARVGDGRTAGVIVLPGQAPTPFAGQVVAFNGVLPGGRPAVLAHLYVTRPAPLTFVLAFAIGRGHGAFGTRLVATVPEHTRRTAHITAFSLRLHRLYRAGGERRSYLSAGCPAPAGFPGAAFPLVRAAYGFVGHETVSETLVRTCRARG